MLRKESLLSKIIVFILPMIAILLIYTSRKFLIHLGTLFPACPSYKYLGIYCPGCGNTRSVQHLLSGDLAGSIFYNPVPLVGIILLLMFYIEIVLACFGRRKQIIPKSKKFWAGFAAVFISYFILRNFI